jgi:cytochrome P450
MRVMLRDAHDWTCSAVTARTQSGSVRSARHARVRALIGAALAPRVVERLRPRIAALVDTLLGDIVDRGAVDIIEALAYPLPTIVIAELLGVPPEDHGVLRSWSEEIAAFFTSPARTVEVARAERGLAGVTDYLLVRSQTMGFHAPDGRPRLGGVRGRPAPS